MTAIETFEIRNRLGIHARVAAKLVAVSNRYRAKIFFEKDGLVIDGKSLLGILTLACPQGSRLTVRAEGPDARDAIEGFATLFHNKFGED